MSDAGEQQDCGWPFLNHCKSREAAMDTKKSQQSFLHHRVINPYQSGCCHLPETIRFIISRVWVCVSQKIQLLVRIKTPEGSFFLQRFWLLPSVKKKKNSDRRLNFNVKPPRDTDKFFSDPCWKWNDYQHEGTITENQSTAGIPNIPKQKSRAIIKKYFDDNISCLHLKGYLILFFY